MKQRGKWARRIALSSIIATAMVGSAGAQVAEAEDPLSGLNSLRQVDVNDHLPDLSGIVTNMDAAKRLGKALFWDIQVGSDGMACASCHFKAGTDPRVRNQLSPGHLLELRDIQGDGTPGDDSFGGLISGDGFTDSDDLSPLSTAGMTAGGQAARANITLSASDFPFHQLQDSSDRNSNIVYTTNDIMSSSGTFGGEFNGLVFGSAEDNCSPAIHFSHIFQTTSGVPTRRVEPRHTPSTINAVFMFDNFWDGRGKNAFNGVDPFGLRTVAEGKAKVLKLQGWSLAPVDLKNSNGDFLKNFSAASQAIGPPTGDHEMSCEGRTWADVGKKLLRNGLRPLQQQQVHTGDSMLGSLSSPAGGLNTSYVNMIRESFHYSYWAGFGTWNFDNQNAPSFNPSGYTQMEHNMAMFFSIAVALYESTLVSGETRFDDFLEGDSSALTASEKRGLDIFAGQGKCTACHATEILTKASTFHLIDENAEEGLVEFMHMAQGSVVPAFYDNGFYNIGVRPTVQDILRGGKDPFDNPLSWTRQFLETPFALSLGAQSFLDMFEIDPCTFEVIPSGVSPESCDTNTELAFIANNILGDPIKDRRAVDGSAKTSQLRNIGLTAPYFSNGGTATLAQLVEAYNRGMNRRGEDTADGPLDPADDTSGTGVRGEGDPVSNQNNGSNLDPDITNLGLDANQQQDLVNFLLSLTDDRVACDSGPFDHPSLPVPNGHDEVTGEDYILDLPAVGASGFPGIGASCYKNSGDLFDQGGIFEVSGGTP